MSIAENTDTSQYFIGYEEEGDGFPDKRGGKFQGTYFFRGDGDELIYTSDNGDDWRAFKEDWKAQQESEESEEPEEEEVVDEYEEPEEEFEEPEEVVDEEEEPEEEFEEPEEVVDEEEEPEEEFEEPEEVVDEEEEPEEEFEEPEEEEPDEEEVVDESFEDTTVYSPSNAGEPLEDPDIPADTNDGNDLNKLDFSSQYSSPNGGGSDTYSGTGGVNTFDFNPLLNAKPEIIEKHVDADGRIDWQGIAGENDNRHDHWVDSLGEDTIIDFSGQGGDGDQINITGHTAAAMVIEESEGQVVLGVYSDQGADGSRGNGAHDLDILGTITVNHDGNFNYGSDVNVNPNVFDGVREFA